MVVVFLSIRRGNLTVLQRMKDFITMFVPFFMYILWFPFLFFFICLIVIFVCYFFICIIENNNINLSFHLCLHVCAVIFQTKLFNAYLKYLYDVIIYIIRMGEKKPCKPSPSISDTMGCANEWHVWTWNICMSR